MPLRVIMIPNIDALAHAEHPHAMASHMPDETNPAIARVRMGRPCAGRMGAMRQKAVELSNTLRHALGLPAIQPDHTHAFGQAGHVIQVSPFVGASPTFIEVARNPDGSWGGRTRGGDKVEIASSERVSLVTIFPPSRKLDLTIFQDYGLMRPVPNAPHGHIHHRPHHRPQHHIHHQRLSFFDRLHFSLMNLGPWEGRAVAFVLGMFLILS